MPSIASIAWSIGFLATFPNDFTNKSNICYANYDSTSKKFFDITNVINVYYGYDSNESKYFLSFTNNPTSFSNIDSSTFSYYKNLYAPYNINSVTTNPDDYCGGLKPRKQQSIYLDTKGSLSKIDSTITENISKLLPNLLYKSLK